MKFDIKQLKQLNQLNFEQVQRWPIEVKIVFAALLAIFVLLVGAYTLITPKIPLLQDAHSKETQLRSQFLAKQRIALNLEAYEAQYAQMETDFSSMLKALPTQDETAGLLDDITYVGTTSGLRFRFIEWQPDLDNAFYTELPIQLEVNGSYHEFGKFVAKVANLPRIVTLHDFTLSFGDNGLRLQMQAKTYRASDSALTKDSTEVAQR